MIDHSDLEDESDDSSMNGRKRLPDTRVIPPSDILLHLFKHKKVMLLVHDCQWPNTIRPLDPITNDKRILMFPIDTGPIKVNNFHMAVLTDKDVWRSQIAKYEALGM